MDFWSQVGDFLGTFKPKDVVTVVLALAATGISIFTAGQTWRYHPKPLLMIEGVSIARNVLNPSEMDIMSGPRVGWLLINRGNGAALDVRVRLTTPALSSPHFGTDGTLEPGASIRQGSSLSDFEMRPIEGWLRADGSTMTRAAYLTPFVEPASIRAVVTWRQSPRIRKVRTMRVRFE